MEIKHGITGNYYITSPHKSQVVSICQYIDKAPSSIYWSDKYQCWCARVKCKKHKDNLRFLVKKMK